MTDIQSVEAGKRSVKIIIKAYLSSGIIFEDQRIETIPEDQFEHMQPTIQFIRDLYRSYAKGDASGGEITFQETIFNLASIDALEFKGYVWDDDAEKWTLIECE